jgi:hypothetical protein
MALAYGGGAGGMVVMNGGFDATFIFRVPTMSFYQDVFVGFCVPLQPFNWGSAPGSGSIFAAACIGLVYTASAVATSSWQYSSRVSQGGLEPASVAAGQSKWIPSEVQALSATWVRYRVRMPVSGSGITYHSINGGAETTFASGSWNVPWDTALTPVCIGIWTSAGGANRKIDLDYYSVVQPLNR